MTLFWFPASSGAGAQNWWGPSVSALLKTVWEAQISGSQNLLDLHNADGLAQIFITSDGLGVFLVFWIGECGEHDDLHSPVDLIVKSFGVENFGGLKPVHLRHVDVHEHEVVKFAWILCCNNLINLVHTLLARISPVYHCHLPDLLKKNLEAHYIVHVVVHDQNFDVASWDLDGAKLGGLKGKFLAQPVFLVRGRKVRDILDLFMYIQLLDVIQAVEGAYFFIAHNFLCAVRQLLAHVLGSVNFLFALVALWVESAVDQKRDSRQIFALLLYLQVLFGADLVDDQLAYLQAQADI